MLFSTVYSTNNLCLKPDDYVLKCKFNPSLDMRSFTCINNDCSDKLYTYSNGIYIADFYNSNNSIKIIKNLINLNEIEENLNLIQILCEKQISPFLIEIFQKKILETKSNLTQSFTGSPLVIQKANKDNLIYNNKKFNCYNSNYDIYLDWQIESRKKKDFCTIKNISNTCFTEEIDIYEYLKESNTYNNLIKYSFVLLLALFIGFVGLFTHLSETRKIKDFIKITKSKIIIAIIIFYPILFTIGKIVDLIFSTTFITSNIMPALTFLLSLLVIYFFASLLHYIHHTHYNIKVKKSKKNLKKLTQKKRI